jgi:uncharacterized protein YbjT (DUF2867 family)
MTKLFLIGGTGGLGHEVAKGLKESSFDEHIAIVRSSSASDKTDYLTSLGYALVVVDDFSQPESLQAALSGATVIVSTLGGAEMTETEIQAMTAAKAVGASLFVPSQFGIDYRRWDSHHPFLAAKAKVLDHAESIGLPTLKVFIGAFSDMIFYFLADANNMTATLVNDGQFRVSLTRRSDIGYVLAKALTDPKYVNGGYLSTCGTTVTWKEALEMVEQAVGKSFEYTKITGEEALQQENELLAKGDMGSFFGSMVLNLLGVPARGSTGFDVSEEAVTLGHTMEPLEVTVKSYAH